MFVQSEPSSQNLVSVATDGEIASRMRFFLTGERINTYFFAGVQSGQFTSVGLSTLETSPPRPLAMYSTSSSGSQHVRPAVQQAVWSWREEVMRQPHCHPAELQRNLHPAEGMPRR